MTAPSPARMRTCYVGQLNDLNSADNVVNEVASVLGTPFRPLGLFYQVITTITTATNTITLNWRPTPGSATGEKLIATWEQPVEAADVVGWISFNENPEEGEVLQAGGEASQYGKDGQVRQVAVQESLMICGPGGELEIDSPDSAAGAGAVEYWLVYEQLDFADTQKTLTRVVPDTVGTLS